MSGELVRRLRGVVDLIAIRLEPLDLLVQLSQSALDLFGAQGACWCELQGDRLQILTAAGLSDELVGLAFPLAGSGVGALLDSGERSLVSRAGRYPHLNAQIYAGPDDQMAIAVATVAGETLGALYVTLRPDHVFGSDELEVLELLASHAGLALHHLALYGEAERARQEIDAVIDAMADGVVVVDAQGVVRTWNSTMTRLTGIAPQTVVGRPVPFALPPAGEVATIEPLPGRWIDVVVSPAGAAGERVVSARDVTAGKELEAAQELFLATASHELRTPLTVLRGFGDTLLRHWEVLGEPRRRELVATMLARTEGMGELVEQILRASQAGLAAEQDPAERFDLTAVVLQAAGVLAGASDGHPLRVDVEGPVGAFGRPRSIAPVLDQLVENAVKYSPAGGPVEISVRRDGDQAVLAVADRGQGVDEADLERVFERFYRSGSQLGGPGGAGLGLWIVRRAAEAQGGSVRALAREGGGTVLEVRLPGG